MNIPEEQIISSTPRMPALLHFTECVQYRLSLGCVGSVIFQTLHKHARVDPRERAAKLRHLPSVTHISVRSILLTNPKNGRPGGIHDDRPEWPMSAKDLTSECREESPRFLGDVPQYQALSIGYAKFSKKMRVLGEGWTLTDDVPVGLLEANEDVEHLYLPADALRAAAQAQGMQQEQRASSPRHNELIIPQ